MKSVCLYLVIFIKELIISVEQYKLPVNHNKVFSSSFFLVCNTVLSIILDSRESKVSKNTTAICFDTRGIKTQG